MTDKLLCWHFANNDLRLGYDDGREIVAGESLRVEGAPVLCETGLYGKIAFPLAATSSRAAFGGYAPDYAISDPGRLFG